MFAVVDIETTGGNASQGSITEIAIFITDGINILDRFTSLVNPKRPIPLFIEKLTGINDEMVKNAPVFGELAKDIHNLLDNKVFVAHNVNFDYSFITHQLSQHGYKLNSKKLCTVRLSRKIFEDLPSYSLGNLCRSLEIGIKERHRAMGDAEATTKLFHKLLIHDSGKHIDSMLKKGSMESYLPMYLSEEDLEKLPNTPGIYYFHDQKGKILYVGKAKRLKKRVTSHFSNNSTGKKKQELMRMVHRISFKEMGNELMMSVMESIEIKRIWPLFNRSQKKFENKFGICSFIDQKGVLRLGIVKKKKYIQTHTTFPMQVDGMRLLNRLAREHGLCPKMCFLQLETVDCLGIEESFCEGICNHEEDLASYNSKVQLALADLQSSKPTIAVFGQGRNKDELTCIVINNKEELHTGFVPASGMKMSLKKLMKHLEPSALNEFIRSTVMNHAEVNPEMSLIFE